MTGLLTLRELAAALSVPVRTLRRTLAELRGEGFPAPLPGTGGRYDPMAVDAWRRRKAGLPVNDPANAPEPDAIEAWQEELDRRSANMRAA